MLFFLGRLQTRSGRVPFTDNPPSNSSRHSSNWQPADSHGPDHNDEFSPHGRSVQDALRQHHRQLEATYYLERSPLR